ncbi:CD206 [Mytilus edulis]|uniref:MRC n=1 Tax=Mytilus edulis TaxID=6550 RepID=A0A8S3TU35_MYTED|nr:CD206 [Mytilus edulis]
MATMFKRPRSPRRKNQKSLKKQRPHNSVFTIHRKRNKHQINKISDRSTKDRSLAADLPIKSSFQHLQKENKNFVTTGTKKQHSDSKDQEETRKKQKNAITHMLNESDTFHENDKKLKNQEIQSHQMLNEPKPSTQHKTEQLDKSSSKPWASIPGLKIPIDDIVLPFDSPLSIIDKQMSGNEERKYKSFYPKSKIKGVHHFGKFRDAVNTMWSGHMFDREHGGILGNSNSLSKSVLKSESAPQVETKINRIASILGQSNHRRKRATGNYNVEVFVVIDFPIYNFWLREENSNSDRAMQRVREYYTFLLLGVDNRFKKMSASYRVAVNLVGIYVAKRSSDLSFIQNHLSGGILNADTALSAMKQWVQTNGIPRHDHIMAFTRYDMRSGSFDTSGTAYLNSICTTRSNSIVEEKFDFIAATVAAHEIGHALGAVHDGENNRCSSSSGFIMVSVSQAMRPPNQKSPWEFSSCTSSEIGLYLDELNKKGSHCMQRTHPNAKNFNPGSQKRLGQTFDVDKQCEFIIGKGSYACRSFIGNSENVCTGVWCKTLDMTSTRCILGLPAEGTTCGSNKCEVRGSVTSVKWFKNNNVISIANSLRFSGSDPNSPSLTINSVTEDDFGYYTCQISDGVYILNADIITLLPKGIPPVVVVPRHLPVPIRGQQFIIPCTIDSSQIPLQDVQWIYINWDGITIDPINITSPLTVKYEGSSVDSPSLVINDYQSSDDGRYMCRATNAWGKDVSSAVLVTLESVPIVVSVQSYYQSEPFTEVILRCSVNSVIPIIKVYWQRNQYEESDAGVYICYASNDFGVGHGTTELRVADNDYKPNCPSGWLYNENSCYLFTITNYGITWFDAKTFCEEHGAKLAEIETEMEDKYILSNMKNLGSRDYFWLGGRDDEVEGSWKWSSGTPFTYTHWLPGEPNDVVNVYKQDYLMTNYAGWIDHPSSLLHVRHYVCEMIANEKNCPSDWLSYDNSCYLFMNSENELDWFSADNACRKNGTILAEIETEAEDEYIRNIIRDQYLREYFWLGGRDDETEGSWKWSSGTPFNYSKWYSGQPDDAQYYEQDFFNN